MIYKKRFDIYQYYSCHRWWMWCPGRNNLPHLIKKKARSPDTTRRAGKYVYELQLEIGGVDTLHRAVLIPKSESRCGRKLCHYCKRHGVTTKKGCPAFARYKCDICNLPFCVRERGCFPQAPQRYAIQRHVAISNGKFEHNVCITMYHKDL